MDTFLTAVGAHCNEEWRVIVGAPIACFLLFALALVLMWLLFRHQLANKRSSIDELDGRVKARDEEIVLLRRPREDDPVPWFQQEALREIARIRLNPTHPFNVAKDPNHKSAVAQMQRLYWISLIDKQEVGKKFPPD